MKKVVIFRHSLSEGPGYLETYLNNAGIAHTLIRVDAGDPLPSDPKQFAGLVFMGGPMSVNDDLPWIPKLLEQIRAAVEDDVPVLGHCLGGQLMSKALGGSVTLNPVKEIGWGKIDVDDHAVAKRWFGDVREFLSFHWHGETFTIPYGATRLASSPYCPNQAFALGPHLGMQCHVEMTVPIIRDWYRGGAEEIRGGAGPAVQTAEQAEIDIEVRTRELNAVARRLYDRWVEGLRR